MLEDILNQIDSPHLAARSVHDQFKGLVLDVDNTALGDEPVAMSWLAA